MRKTPLYERHLALGAAMTEFGGWTMPVQYTGVIDEHKKRGPGRACSMSVTWERLTSRARRPSSCSSG